MLGGGLGLEGCGMTKEGGMHTSCESRGNLKNKSAKTVWKFSNLNKSGHRHQESHYRHLVFLIHFSSEMFKYFCRTQISYFGTGLFALNCFYFCTALANRDIIFVYRNWDRVYLVLQLLHFNFMNIYELIVLSRFYRVNHVTLHSTWALKLKYLLNIRITKDCLLPYFCLGLGIFDYGPSFIKSQAYLL